MELEHREKETSRAAAQLRVQLAQMTAASQLLEQCAWDQKGKSYLAAMNQGICRMLRIVGRMELCGRLDQEISPEPLDLAALTRDLGERMEGLLDRAGVKLTVDCPERLLTWADGALVRQLLLELVANGAAAGKTVRLTLKQDRNDAVFTVEDDGPGLPPQRAAALFGGGGEAELPDWRQDGIGVAVSRRIVALHGGRLFPVCEPGRGLRVLASFPLNQKGGENLRCATAFDAGGFDEAMVGLSHLLPAGVFAPGEFE